MKDYFWSKETGAIDYIDLEDHFDRDKVDFTNLETSFFERKPERLQLGGAILQCKKCHSDKFLVSSEKLSTVIKCPECGWELCIHDG